MSVLLDASLSAAVQPPPSRAGRLVDERDGFRVEFSPGQEAYVEAVFAEVPAWRMKFKEQEARILGAGGLVVQPGSARDLLAHRDEILRTAAAEIGLSAPTALQGRVFDTMLRLYELKELRAEMVRVVMLTVANCDEIQIWAKSEIERRLAGGEQVEGFSWNPQTKKGGFKISPPEFSMGDEETEAQKAFDAARLDHSFNYRPGADGTINIRATFTLPRGERLQPLQPAASKLRLETFETAAREYIRAQKPTSWPIILSETTASSRPEADVTKCFGTLEGMLKCEKCGDSRQPDLLHMVLHEVVEIGLVENYIGSADRRWLCDGVAEYVAWKMVRDRCGAEVARQAYGLDAQLARYASLQKQIDLRRWLAVENTKEEERETDLTKARYAFATRAVFELVRRNDESLLPRLLQEVAKTPRKKVRMETVEKAYRKLTGKKLSEVLKYAETAPVPVAAK